MLQRRTPADAAAGAPHVRKFVLKLFDRGEKKAAEWPVIAEPLLREAFHALDQSRGDPRVLALLLRVNSGSHDRLTSAPEVKVIRRCLGHKIRPPIKSGAVAKN